MNIIALEMIRQGLSLSDIVSRLQSMQVYMGRTASRPETLTKYINKLKGVPRHGRRV